jgi:hypothetical protein
MSAWRVDEYETYRIDGPDGARLRCYIHNGTELGPDVAERVAATLNAHESWGDRVARWLGRITGTGVGVAFGIWLAHLFGWLG